ncbi:unnamed protein product [Protopolystoma xenopodis]|uniref:CUB domain-containing protein n=1 Tax=Protopolystoma xenopodis TaxID=117903 RepID=A0A3S5CD29_9PLAT|nr:unnamed protein product [Protopolystoma xenopodis]
MHLCLLSLFVCGRTLLETTGKFSSPQLAKRLLKPDCPGCPGSAGDRQTEQDMANNLMQIMDWSPESESFYHPTSHTDYQITGMVGDGPGASSSANKTSWLHRKRGNFTLGTRRRRRLREIGSSPSEELNEDWRGGGGSVFNSEATEGGGNSGSSGNGGIEGSVGPVGGLLGGFTSLVYRPREQQFAADEVILCQWRINAVPGERVLLNFTLMDIRDSSLAALPSPTASPVSMSLTSVSTSSLTSGQSSQIGRSPKRTSSGDVGSAGESEEEEETEGGSDRGGGSDEAAGGVPGHGAMSRLLFTAQADASPGTPATGQSRSGSAEGGGGSLSCVDNYVEVRDGYHSKAPLIGKHLWCIIKLFTDL